MLRPKERVCKWVDAFNNHDVEAIMSLYHDNATNHQVTNDPVIGIDAIREMFTAEFATADMTAIGKNRTGASCKIFWHCILVDHPGKRDPYRRNLYLSDGISGRIQLYSRPENRTASSVCRFFECVDSIDCSPCPYKASPSGGSSSGRVSLGAVGYFSAILSGKRYGSYGDMSTLHGMAD